jgi:hypothetical protein
VSHRGDCKQSKPNAFVFVGHIKEGFIPTIQPNWLDNRERFCLLFLRTRRMNVTTAKDWSTAHKEGYGLFLRSHHSRM